MRDIYPARRFLFCFSLFLQHMHHFCSELFKSIRKMGEKKDWACSARTSTRRELISVNPNNFESSCLRVVNVVYRNMKMLKLMSYEIPRKSTVFFLFDVFKRTTKCSVPLRVYVF